jgi:hypothetical protein
MSESHRTSFLTDADLPPCQELISSDEAVYTAAWERAYRPLWNAGMGYASKDLFTVADQEDAVCNAIAGFRQALMKTGCEKFSDFFQSNPEE